MKSQNTKSSDQLKREVDKEIRNVKRDLDELEGRLSPGQIIDDAIFYSHGRNLRSTLDHLKRNPVGTTFLSLGTILLMEDETHQTYETSAKAKISSARSTLNEKVNVAKHSLESKAGEIKSSFAGAKDKNQDRFQHQESTTSQFGADAGAYDETLTGRGYEAQESRLDKFKDKASNLKEKASDLRGRASQKASNLKNRASNFYSSGRDKVSHLDPMAYMALGAGLGALTGASLPVSDKEQNFVDEKLSDKFSNLSQELQDAINESSNILKDLVIDDVKNMDLKLFRS